jgi:hypothetical protein
MRDLEAIEDRAGCVDDAHRVGVHRPVQTDKPFATGMVAHRQTPGNCGLTARVGRRGGKLINRRSRLLGLALHLGARRGLPAPRLALTCWYASHTLRFAMPYGFADFTSLIPAGSDGLRRQDDVAPSLHPHYRGFIAYIWNKVLMFRTKASVEIMPPTHRLSSGP